MPILSIPVVLLLFACNDPFAQQAALQKLALVYPSTDNVVIKNTALAPLTPTLTPAGTRATYTIDPAAPAWLAFNPATGAISATAATTKDAPFGRTEYFITATGTGAYAGQSARAKVAITMIEAGLTGVKYREGPLRITAGSGAVPDRTATLLPADAAGDVTYTITPALPAGLSLDPVSGTISGVGTPTTVTTGVYTITATGKPGTLYQGAEAATAIEIEVAPVGFGAIAYNITSPLTETARAGTGTAITPRTITAPAPAAHTDLTYAIHPNLNNNTGLSFNTTDGKIHGTPSTVAATATTYIVTATGNSGTIYEGATQTTTLSVQVNPVAFNVSYAASFTDDSNTSPTILLGIRFPDADDLGKASGRDGTNNTNKAFQITFTTADTNINILPTVNPPAAIGSGSNLATYSIDPADLNTRTGLSLITTPGTDYGRLKGNSLTLDTSGTTYTITVTGAAGTIHAGREVNVYLNITVTNP